jgi:4-hydroxy-3-methylbut-2-en-1-yl diphosphate reductase
VALIGSVQEAEALEPDGRDVAYVTQTTLSIDDARDIIAALKQRFPSIHVPPVDDIWYATTNRQDAVKAAARDVEAFIVVGASNSSNSQRLREVAEREGCAAQLIADTRATDWRALEGVLSVAVTACASAPEALVDHVVDALRERNAVALERLTTAMESMAFPPPRDLRPAA